MEIAYAEVLRSIKGSPCPWGTVDPPNRLETPNMDFIAGFGNILQGNSLETLRDALKAMTGKRHIFFAPSCRCAIAKILSLLPHKEVVMPAFTCPVVKTAVEVAGKRILFVDIAKNGLNSTSAEYHRYAKPGRVLLPTHLFGIPTDIENICELAKDQGCVTIEDAAAAFGADRGGRPLGTFADFGIFSFERSKRLPAFRGAFIVVNNENILDPSILDRHQIVPTKQKLPVWDITHGLAYNFATIPWLYGRFTLPHLLQKYARRDMDSASTLPLDATFTPYYTKEFHPYQAALVLRALSRWDGIRDHIKRLVSLYREVFRNAPIETFLEPGCDESALLRFPIVFSGRERTEILRLALKRGLYLETNYERPLVDTSEYLNFPNAVWAARNMVLMPLYMGLSTKAAEESAKRVVKIAEEVSN